jgi:mannose-6-phosphate isomerase-like protein (cupin superfamily)
MYNYEKVIDSLFFLLKKYKISITESDLLNLLKITNRWPYSYSYIKDVDKPSLVIIGEWSVNYRDDIYDKTGKFNYQRWEEKYNNGFTTILADVLDLTEELRILQNELSKISGKNIYANFYFTRGSNKHRVSFDHHSHDYDVFIKTIYGNCKWKIGDEYFNCKSGDVIYIPKGTYHSAVECTDKKLSLTINLQ